MLQYLDMYMVVGFLFLISLMAGQVSYRTNIPALLLFIFIGMLAGNGGIGGIEFSNAPIANSIGNIALMFILFAGGFDTSWDEVKPILGIATVLATLGVFLTAVFLAVFAWLVLGMDPIDGLLLGSIISSTDAAAVFSILRNQKCGLKGHLKPLLEFESGSNDPMAIFLTMAVLGVIKNPDSGVFGLFVTFIGQMILGGVLGFVCGKMASFLMNKMRISNESLYPVFGISVVLLTFGLTNSLGGNGFLAVYICGIVLSNSDFIYKHSLNKFHAGFANIMQVGMFLILGLFVNPWELKEVAWAGVLASLFLMFAARPLSVFISMFKTNYTLKEKTLIGWTGLRGAVPIILATYPMLDNYQYAGYVFNLIFFVVILSVLVQGQTLTMVARLLHLDIPFKPSPQYPLEFTKTAQAGDEETREVDIENHSKVVGKKVQELKFPAGVAILLIERKGRFLIPKGDTVMTPGDTLLIFGERKKLPEVVKKLGEKVHEGDMEPNI